MNDRRSTIEDIVQARMVLDDLDTARRTGDAPAVPFGRLYRFATSMGSDDAQIEEIIAGNADVASTLEALLQRLALYHIPIAAAAADRSAIDRRHGDGWTLQLTPASNGRQIWVIIDLEREAVPTLLFAGAVRRELPPPDNGHIQFRVRADDALAAALRQPANAIYLT